MEGDPQLTLSLKISSVDDNYLIEPQIAIPQQLAPKIVRQSYIFFVLELRSGLTNDCLISLQRHLLDSCEEIIEQQLKGISFIINGEHHAVKQLSIPHIKNLLTQIMVLTENDDYHPTLIKVRHSVQTMAQKLHQTKISLVFFFSYVKIDHSLGTKKRSYIDKLNEHSEACSEEIERLSKTIRKFTDECKTYVISFDKKGEQYQDYSLADTQLMSLIIMRVGNYGSSIIRNVSFIQLGEAFKEVTCLLYAELYSLTILLPIQPTENDKDNVLKIWMQCQNLNDFKPSRTTFILKRKINLQKININGLSIENYQKLEEKIGEFMIKTQTVYIELDPNHLIVARTQSYCEQIGTICWKLSQEILSYKLIYLAGKCYRQMKVNQTLLQNLRQRIDTIYNASKQIYQQIFSSHFLNKHELFETYSELKNKLDSVNQVLLSVFKKQLGGTEIGRLSQAIVSGPVKRALKNKLIRRINANPYLLNHIYANITQYIDKGNIDFWNLQVSSQNIRSQLGNCILTDYNFVKSLQEYDALGVAFQIQRPESAIGDPGRIRIRQISPSLMRVSKFFQKFLYKIQFQPSLIELVLGRCAICKKYCSYIKYCTCIPREIIEAKTLKYTEKVVKLQTVEWGKDISKNTYDEDQSITQVINFTPVEEGFLRIKGELIKSNYQEAGDYTDRTGRTTTVLGFMPLYLTHEHWKVAKQLMKPCLAFTATGQPLGYVFSQYQIIPFMVLSSVVRTCKELDYSLHDEKSKVNDCKTQQQLYALETRVNKIKEKIQRFQKLLQAVNVTCKAILIELSSENFDSQILETLEQQYRNYQDPINRTVDKISNNSSFLGQLFCAFQNELLPKPKAQNFNNFFKRLVEEELRRETDGWNQEYTQDCFIDKMLNVESNNIKEWQVSVIGGEEYYDKFKEAEQGNHVQMTKVSLQKEELAMMLRKDGKFNQSQRLLMIEYKRLYENRVLWMWYVRFRLYGQLQRVQIHKWKCLQLINSYQLFTLIIQNKKQRKNFKRREAIANGQYADPFNYVQAREYLENEFIQLRSKKESQMIKIQNTKVCIRAASVFAESGCLEEVAGTLLGMNDQWKNLPLFYEQLIRGKAVRIEQKLKMLLYGEFKDVYLFKGWKMSKQRMNKLRQKYKYEFGRYQYMF